MRLLSPDSIRAFPESHCEYSSVIAPGVSRHGRAETSAGIWRESNRLHRAFVDEHLDHGPIILQKSVPVLEGDDVHSLSARILEQEHTAYSEAIGLLLSGEVEIRGRAVVRRQVRAEGK